MKPFSLAAIAVVCSLGCASAPGSIGSPPPSADAPALEAAAPEDTGAAAPEDTGAADAGSGMNDAETAAADSAPPPAVDAPAPTDANRCLASAPRLRWTQDEWGVWRCLDSDLGNRFGYDVACSFLAHADGSIRCLPVIGGARIAWSTPGCVGAIWIQCGTWSPVGPPTAAAGITRAIPATSIEGDGAHVRSTFMTATKGTNAYDGTEALCGIAAVSPVACDASHTYGLVASEAAADEFAADQFVAAPF